MLEKADEYINAKDYITMSHDYELWDIIHKCMYKSNDKIPFDISFDEFIIQPENEALVKSRRFQLSMLLWIEELRCA